MSKKARASGALSPELEAELAAFMPPGWEERRERDDCENEALLRHAAEQLQQVEIETHIRRASQPMGGPDERGRAASFRQLRDLYLGQVALCERAQQDAREGTARLPTSSDEAFCALPPSLMRERVSAMQKLRDAKLVEAQIDPRLETFFARIGRQLIEGQVTLKALTGKGKPGPEGKNEERDFEIAVSVQQHVQQGKSLRKAYDEIAKVEGRSWLTVKAIYRRFDASALKAEIAFIEEHAKALEDAARKPTHRDQ